jgi:hypothetical protein
MADDTSANEANLPHPEDTPEIPVQNIIRGDPGNVDELHETHGDEARPSPRDEKPLEVKPTEPHGISAATEVGSRIDHSLKDQSYIV